VEEGSLWKEELGAIELFVILVYIGSVMMKLPGLRQSKAEQRQSKDKAKTEQRQSLTIALLDYLDCFDN